MSIKYNLCCPYILDIWPSTGTRSIPGNTALRETYFPSPNSYQLSVAPQLRVGLCAHLPSSCLVWACLSLMLAVTTAGCSYVWVLYCVWMSIKPLAYTTSVSFSAMILSLGRRGYDIYDPPRAELSAPLPGVGFCVSHQLLQREVSLLQVKRCTDLGSNIDIIVLNRLPMTYYSTHSFVQFNTMPI